MNERLKKIQKEISGAGADAYWCSDSGNRRYLSGFTGSSGWLVIPRRGIPVIITDGRYTEQVKQECPGWAVVDDPADRIELLCKFFLKNRMQKVILEEEKVSVADWTKVKKCMQKIKGISSGGMLEEARAIKDDQEIKKIKKAVQIAENAYKKVFPRIKAGLKEIEVAMLIEKTMMEMGGEGPAFATIVASGKNSALPHARPGGKRLRKGELVVLDFGCVYKGYHSDLTRTIGIARITGKQQELYKTVKKAQISAKKSLNSGQMAADSDRIARDVFRSGNLDKFFVHGLGHGIGLKIHERPRLSPKSNECLCAGMIVTCEPGIYIPGWGGIRIEDDVLIRDSGSSWLSESSETLSVADRSC